jgi:deazaflavin-dependent oxidoreductase (nitroreductase family)
LVEGLVLEIEEVEMARSTRLLGAAGLALVGILALFQVAAITLFRTRWHTGIDAVRRFNRRWLNPWMMQRAGSAGWYASAIHHQGRRSGHRYVTPVLAERVGDHFLIPLPYGNDVDWCRNIVATGEADLDSDGEHLHLVAPRVVDSAAAEPQLPSRLRRRLSLYGVDEYLELSV